MSLGFIANQPVYFQGQDNSGDDLPQRGAYGYQIPVKYSAGDKTYVQMKIAPVAGSTNLVSDASFLDPSYWSTTGSGVVGVGLATIGNGSSGSVYKDLTGTIIIGKNYQLKISIQSIFGTAKIYDGTTLIGEVNGTGTYTLSYTATNDSVFVKIFDSTSYIEFTNLSIRALPENFAFGILDEGFNTVEVINFIDDPEFFTIKKDTLTVIVDWDALNLSQGCYYLATTDPETNNCNQFGLYNHDFTVPMVSSPLPDTAGWSGSDATDVLFYDTGGGYAQMTVNGIGTNYITNTKRMFCAGKNYTVVVSASRGADPANLSIRVGATATATQALGGSLSDYTFNITPAADGYMDFINTNNLSGVNAIAILDITVTLTSETDWSFEHVTVDKYKLAEMADHETKLVAVFNNEDGLGFIFNGSNFWPQVRVTAKFINRKRDQEKETLKNDKGTKAVMFAEGRNGRLFRIENVPTYIHDFLALSTLCDQFYINNIIWFVETDKYQEDYVDDLDNYAPSEIEVSVPTQSVRNINSGETNAPPSDVEIIAPDGEILVEGESGTIIEGRL